ncbi:tetratricopeptide repeat protein, partial [Actinomadura sp. KC06]
MAELRLDSPTAALPVAPRHNEQQGLLASERTPCGHREHPKTAVDRVIRIQGLFAGSRQRQATIQFASTLRNLGRAEESVALLTA